MLKKGFWDKYQENAKTSRKTSSFLQERIFISKESKMKKVTVFFLMFFLNVLIGWGQKYPEFFGIYLVADGKFVELKENSVSIKTPNQAGSQEDSVSGLKSLSNVNSNDTSAYIIIYLESIDINKIKLSKLRFSKTESLVSISIMGNAKKYMTNINMWVFEKDVPFRMGPIDGRKGMYKIVPSGGFESGVYAIHGGSIRNERIQGGGIGIYTASAKYGDTANDFSIGKISKDVGVEPESQG